MEPRRQSSWQNNIDWSQKLVWFSGSTQTNKNYLTNSVIYSSIQLIRGGKKKAYVSDHYSKNPTYEFICSMCQYLRTQTWRIERRERIGVGSPTNNIVKIVTLFFFCRSIWFYCIKYRYPCQFIIIQYLNPYIALGDISCNVLFPLPIFQLWMIREKRRRRRRRIN